MLNVAIIGIGNIALLFDTDINNKNTITSHIKAIYFHDEFTLKYVSDIDDSNLVKVQEFFPDVIFTQDYQTLIEKKDIDILVICTPTSTHYEILKSFKSNTNIQLFFMEKPLFHTSEEYKNINTYFQDKIIVNYLRRFDSEIQKLKLKIEEKKFDALQKIIIKYCKGIKNNGSHMIDMINFLFDKPEIVSTNILSQTAGFSEQDPTYDIQTIIKYQNQKIPIYFIGLDHNYYNTIEVELFFLSQIVKYVGSKSEIGYYDIVTHTTYPAYKISSSNPTIRKTSSKLLLNSYQHIFNMLKYNATNISSFEDERYNIQFLDTILEKKL